MDNLYDICVENDVLGWLRPLWDGGGWTMGDDGILRQRQSQIAIDTPWLHHGHADYANCMLWHQVMFNLISERIEKLLPDTGKRFVPSGCQNCWKVVVRPQTIVQLFALNELQSKSDRPSKAGIEPRSTVEGSYGGYFYNDSYELGQESYVWVREAVDNYPNLGPEVPVILKRACTEMEFSVGPSDQWEVTEEQKRIEALIEKWVEINPEAGKRQQPENVITRVMRRWIEFAAERGDMTYLVFTGGKRVNKSYVTYHEDDQWLKTASMSGK